MKKINKFGIWALALVALAGLFPQTAAASGSIRSITAYDPETGHRDYGPNDLIRIGETLALGASTSWLDYLDSAPVKDALAASRGHWSNYVKSAVLRFQMASDLPLSGMDLVCGGEVPVAAGLNVMV